MPELLDSLNMWGRIAIVAVVVVIAASLAERRREKRANMDKVGFMPWTFIMVMGVLTAVFAASLAIKG